ncbi:hypothetical protein pEaSNUABM54_00306 [Erwinia phage pEa_SNUABM_54]|nr:hypothetical protein pEaSNUABM54_00306 [Erwinia phage pEa_SNUABM_54]
MSRQNNTMPRMSKADTTQSYHELDRMHQHCLSLIATCTQLGVEIRNVELMKQIDDLSSFTDRCMKVAANLERLTKRLDGVVQRDKAARTKRIDGNNIMQVLATSREYEEWLQSFTREVGNYINPALEQLAAARERLKAPQE